MKGIREETARAWARSRGGSDHCPAMKGICYAAYLQKIDPYRGGSDHCPAMKGIENESLLVDAMGGFGEATTAPQ